MFVASARQYYNENIRRYYSKDRKMSVREALETLDSASDIPVIFSCNNKDEKAYIENLVSLYKRKTGNEYVCRYVRARNKKTLKYEYFVAVWALKYNLEDCAIHAVKNVKPDISDEIKVLYKFAPEVWSDTGELN